MNTESVDLCVRHLISDNATECKVYLYNLHVIYCLFKSKQYVYIK